MTNQRNKRSQTSDSRGAVQTANPAEISRRDLVAWCVQHQLPVPVERRPQSSGR